MNKNETCCFTGHRYAKRERLVGLYETLVRLTERGVRSFLSGGAEGFDLLAAECVLSLKRTRTEIRFVMVLPCPSAEQTAKWTEESRRRYYEILRQADEVILTSGKYHKNCYRMRNEAMVKMSSYCVCFYDKSDWRSGTGMTVRMCEKNGVEIYNLH